MNDGSRSPVYRCAPPAWKAGALLLLGLAACQGIPLSPEEYFHQANRRLDSGDADGAVELYDEVLAQNPGHPLALNNRGLACIQLGRLEEALGDFDHCLAHPNAPLEAWYNRGTARLRAGNPRGAVEDFTRAVEGDPRYAKAWAARGLALLKIGDRAAARLDLQKALDSGPKDWADRPALQAELDRLP